MDFSDKTVCITGAAGGLGTECVLAFLRAGAHVVAIDNDPAKIAQLDDAARTIEAGRLTVLSLDLADLSGLRRALDDTAATCGCLDIVINNAAIYPSKSFEDYTIDEHQAVQRVNVDAGIICVQAALPGMRAKAWGRIINMSSVTVYGGWAKLSPYVQSKGALVGLTRAWAREFGAYGVTVNAIAPGAFPTDAEKIHPDPAGYTAFVLDHQAIKRRGNPRDIAAAMMFLASDSADFITGQVLNVDGGWVMH